MSNHLKIKFNHRTCEVDLDALFHQATRHNAQQVTLDTEIKIPGSHKSLQIHVTQQDSQYFYHIKNLRKLYRYADNVARSESHGKPPTHAVVHINDTAFDIKKAEGSWNRRFMTPIGCTFAPLDRKYIYSTNIYVNRHSDDDVISYFMQEVLKPHKLRLQVAQLIQNYPHFDLYRSQLALPAFKEAAVIQAGMEADAQMDYELLVWANRHVKTLDAELKILREDLQSHRNKKERDSQLSTTLKELERTDADIKAEHEEAFLKISQHSREEWQAYTRHVKTGAFSHNIMPFGKHGDLYARHSHILNSHSIVQKHTHQYQLPQLKSVFEGMWLLFAAGIYHGDISPGNVVENADKQFFLIDFGFSDALTQEKCLHDLWASYSGGTYLYRLPYLLSATNQSAPISAEMRVLNDIYGLCFSFLSPYFQNSINHYSHHDLKQHSDGYFKHLLKNYAQAESTITADYRHDSDTQNVLLLMLELCRDIWNHSAVHSSMCITLLSKALGIKDELLIDFSIHHHQHWADPVDKPRPSSSAQHLTDHLVARPSQTIKLSEQLQPFDSAPIARSTHAENSHERPIPARQATAILNPNSLTTYPTHTKEMAAQIKARVSRALENYLHSSLNAHDKHVIGTGFLHDSADMVLKRTAIHALHDILTKVDVPEKTWRLFLEESLWNQLKQAPMAAILAEAFRASLRVSHTSSTFSHLKKEVDDVKVATELLNFIKTNKGLFVSHRNPSTASLLTTVKR